MHGAALMEVIAGSYCVNQKTARRSVGTRALNEQFACNTYVQANSFDTRLLAFDSVLILSIRLVTANRNTIEAAFGAQLPGSITRLS